jgi:hypothetical protein
MLADRLRMARVDNGKSLIQYQSYLLLNNRGTYDSTQDSTLSIKNGDILLDTAGTYFFMVASKTTQATIFTLITLENPQHQ